MYNFTFYNESCEGMCKNITYILTLQQTLFAPAQKLLIFVKNIDLFLLVFDINCRLIPKSCNNCDIYQEETTLEGFSGLCVQHFGLVGV